MSHVHDSRACSAGRFDSLCVSALGRNKSCYIYIYIYICVCVYVCMYIYILIYCLGSVTHLFQVATGIISCTVLCYLLGLRAAEVLG